LAFELGAGEKREDDSSKAGEKINPLGNLWVKGVSRNDAHDELNKGNGNADSERDKA
jgi:hypothetical protein